MDRPAILRTSAQSPLRALLFAEPDCSTALWGDPRYAAVLAELKDIEVDSRLSALAKSRQYEVECVREVLAAIAGARKLDREGMLNALARQLAADGPMVPPLVVVDGEIEVTFDGAAQLGVNADVAEALAPDDAAVREAAAQARVLRAAAEDPRTLALGLQRLRQAVTASEGDPRTAAQVVTELLCAQRQLARRKVFGADHVQLLLHLADGAIPIPCYLAWAEVNQLPLFRRFAVSLLAEVHPPQDTAAAGRCALRVVALVRTVDAEHWHAGQWPGQWPAAPSGSML